MGVPIAVVCCLIAGIVVFLIFTATFFIELLANDKNKKSIRRIKEKHLKPEKVEEPELDIDAMLSALEEKAKFTEEAKEEVKAEKPEKVEIKIINPVEEDQSAKQEIADLINKITAELEEEEKKESAIKEKVEEKKEETVVEENEQPKVERVVVETVEIPVVFDYNTRVEKIKENLSKLEKDLNKSEREVKKYERVEKRKSRNEKLLDRKSNELTNLNLVLYNVNDIKEIDPEKKQKQEELTTHIAELKESIKDGKEFLEVNKEKYLNSVKIRDFLCGEKARYEEEIAELETLISESKKNKK